MKFDYCKETSLPGCGAPSSYPYTYHFQFSLSYDEIQKVFHKYGMLSPKRDNIREALEYDHKNNPHMIQWSLRLLQDAFTDDGIIDFGIDYKKKYEELVELLEPHKIDESMQPLTTLKMLLKYHK